MDVVKHAHDAANDPSTVTASVALVGNGDVHVTLVPSSCSQPTTRTTHPGAARGHSGEYTFAYFNAPAPDRLSGM